MSFINSYKPLDASISTVGGSFDDPYDINSSIPVPSLLESARVQLTPFIPRLHAERFFAAYHKDMSTLIKYFPFEWHTCTDFITSFEKFVRQDPSAMLFVIIDKTKLSSDARTPAGRIAGITGWFRGDMGNRLLEMGPVLILTEFQRTHVTTNAIGLLLKYVLDLPEQGGLGFRRVAWSADPLNQASISAAEKMGFEKEGVLRWCWVLSPGREGGKPVNEDRGHGIGRGSILLSLCWDTWVSGARDTVVKRMESV